MPEANAQPTAAHALQSNDILRHSDATKTACSPQRRAHRRETTFFIVRIRRRQCTCGPQRRMHRRETTFFVVRMGQSNTQPTKACALQGDEILRHSDDAQPTAAQRTAETRHSSLFGCDTNATRSPQRRARCREIDNVQLFGCDRNAQPTAACALQGDAILRHSDATKAMPTAAHALQRDRQRSSLFGCDKATRSPQRRARCRETPFCGIRMRQRQCAAHSGVRTAEKRHSAASGATKAGRSPQRRTHGRETTFFIVRMRHEGNTQPTAARALQREDILRHSKRRRQDTAGQRNCLIHGCPHDCSFLV